VDSPTGIQLLRNKQPWRPGHYQKGQIFAMPSISQAHVRCLRLVTSNLFQNTQQIGTDAIHSFCLNFRACLAQERKLYPSRVSMERPENCSTKPEKFTADAPPKVEMHIFTDVSPKC
jgi:hypothetical protein